MDRQPVLAVSGVNDPQLTKSHYREDLRMPAFNGACPPQGANNARTMAVFYTGTLAIAHLLLGPPEGSLTKLHGSLNSCWFDAIAP